ncbi:hypothetical protein OPV22_010883 [Ensete ventricosum]|uniref:Protein WAVE n=1 Tax=Ensete ventricosum TaxID=4639 RepID=A0AAV8RID2_ENSVE|nr:hypothetical protein OPV22_010883 [Ensete ventricosum]
MQTSPQTMITQTDGCSWNQLMVSFLRLKRLKVQLGVSPFILMSLQIVNCNSLNSLASSALFDTSKQLVQRDVPAVPVLYRIGTYCPYRAVCLEHVFLINDMRHHDNEFDMLKPDSEATCEVTDDLKATLCKILPEDIESTPASFMDNEASINRNQFDPEFTDALLRNPPGSTGSVEEAKLYSEKSVTQIKPIEIIIFSKDDTCSVVKDICIEEGSSSLKKVLLENNGVSETSVSTINMNNDLNGQMTDNAAPGTQDSRFISAVDKVVEEQDYSWSLSVAGEKTKTTDQVQSNSSVLNLSSKLLPSPGESETDHHHVVPTSFDFSSDQRQCLDKERIEQNKIEDTSSTMTTLPFSDVELDKSNVVKENPTSDASKVMGDGCSITTHMIFDVTMSNHSAAEGNPANSDVDVRVTDPTFESGAATTVKENRRGDRDSQEFVQVQNCSVSEMTAPDATTAPAQSLLYHSNHGDLNFSGPKASSGHIAYSGNISMRSDSSTTSTRSFAFPILQTEWNTSPVKMAKARKPRRWWMGLICCKF